MALSRTTLTAKTGDTTPLQKAVGFLQQLDGSQDPIAALENSNGIVVNPATEDTLAAGLGTPADAAWTGAGNSSIVAALKAIWSRLAGVVLGSGSAIIGKVGIDQTTPGTTNGVVAVGAQFTSFGASIASGASLSGVVDLGTYRLFGIVMDPIAWTAAAMTFQVSIDGTNFFNLFDDTGVEINWTVLAQQFVTVSQPAKWQGIRYIKVRSGTSATPVNQGAARTLTLIGVP